MTWPTRHITAEDLDAFHSASLTNETIRHLDECAECRSLVEEDRWLVSALERLPRFTPTAGFADRVLARTDAPVPVAVRSWKPRRLALAASLLLALGGSVGWSLMNRTLLVSWIEALAAQAGRTVWLAVASVAQSLSEQPWAEALIQFGSAGERLALAGGALALTYGLALVGLRRLLVLPGRPASHADW